MVKQTMWHMSGTA